MAFELANHFVRLAVADDGCTAAFVDLDTGADAATSRPFSRVRRGDTWYDACAASDLGDGRLQLTFDDDAGSATLAFESRASYLVAEVVAVEGADVDELLFVDVELVPRDGFAACALALDLQTNVPDVPGLGNQHLRASCFARFGFPGARAAIVAAPADALRGALQDAVRDDLRLPYSTIGGPFALDAPINRGSYLFNFEGVTLDEVDDWIEVIRGLGFDQLDFHGGRSFRFGDCRPDPERYPDGFASLKAVIDRLHDAGIAAGLHTYAFFIDKACPWVTPVPDPRLGKDATLTLARALSTDDAEVAVTESTTDMSATTGFFVRNSVTLQVDDELITYTAVGDQGFTGCERGAWGTRVATHEAGAEVHHLKECFGLFAPDPETTLLAEVAAASATAFNECGFDMIYLDALDGEDILGGGDVAWHYGSRFAMELWQRLEKPALMEMSTFHHHLWYVRSRMGAWDHPTRSHKRFIDIHCDSNLACNRMFLPANLGWWAFKTYTGHQGEPTFADDIEYWCAKAIGTGAGLSLMGIDPTSAPETPALPRLADIVQRYERLRRGGSVPEPVRTRLAEPGAEFTLVGAGDDARFHPVHSERHKVDCLEDWASAWRVDNPHSAQAPRIRIEALESVAPFGAPEAVVLADFADTSPFVVKETAADIAVHLETAPAPERTGSSGHLHAASARDERRGAWARVGRTFTPPIDLSAVAGLGVWVHGDGHGELLNLQLRSPVHLSHAIGEHYVLVDFTGWRYVELVEPEGERYAHYEWPYGNMYSIYRESITAEHVGSLDLWLNDLPPGGVATCYLGPIHALPLRPARIERPSLTLGGSTITFPVVIEEGQYLECESGGCTLFGTKGEVIEEVAVEGDAPSLASGGSEVRFSCQPPADGLRPRARVTLSTRGPALA